MKSLVTFSIGIFWLIGASQSIYATELNEDEIATTDVVEGDATNKSSTNLNTVSSSAPPPRTISTIEQAIDESINSNPEILANWHELNAAMNEKRQAFGQYLPQVEISSQVAHTDSADPQFVGSTYNSNLSRLSITQSLYNGGGTYQQVKKLGYRAHARFYELKDSSESIALQAVQAYLDVLRYQSLVSLAKESYIEHRLLHKDIKQRSLAGISRTADFQQAEARLALSESNLLTENTNLHDVTVRFIRLLGKAPAKKLTEPRVPGRLIPHSVNSALQVAYQSSPVILAASYNLKSSESEVKETRALHLPKLDLRAHKELYDDSAPSTAAAFDDTTLELVLSYKLYAGGSHQATYKQYKERQQVQWQLREKACRDVTQNVSVAFNNIINSKKQIKLLEKNKNAISRVRIAYKNQFSIGQRTLLDLLDTENEFFDVQRSYVNAIYDSMDAEVTTLAGMGKLSEAFSSHGLPTQAKETYEIETTTNNKLCRNHSTTNNTQARDILAEALADKRLQQYFPVKPVVITPVKRLSFRLNVQFQNGSAVLPPSYTKDFEVAANYLTENPSVKAIIEGHTDSVGSENYNQRLSEARSKRLMHLLIHTYNIAPNRLEYIGYGEQVPIATNSTEQGRRENRRVLLVITDE